jgi:hypothetical protein
MFGLNTTPWNNPFSTNSKNIDANGSVRHNGSLNSFRSSSRFLSSFFLSPRLADALIAAGHKKLMGLKATTTI